MGDPTPLTIIKWFREGLRIFTELSRKDPKLIFWQHSFSRLIGDMKQLI